MAPDDERDRYTLTMCCKNTVPRYGPPLATGGHYMRDEYFRQVLLTKRTGRHHYKLLALNLLLTLIRVGHAGSAGAVGSD